MGTSAGSIGNGVLRHSYKLKKVIHFPRKCFFRACSHKLQITQSMDITMLNRPPEGSEEKYLWIKLK